MGKWRYWAVLLIAGTFFFANVYLLLSHSPYSPNLYECVINMALLILASVDIYMPRKVDDLLHSTPLVAKLVGSSLFAILAYMELISGPVSISRLVVAAIGIIIALRLLFPSSNGK